jgi:hypothetical protein
MRWLPFGADENALVPYLRLSTSTSEVPGKGEQ